MQCSCTAAHRAVTEGVVLEAPVLLGEKLENVGFDMFSKTCTIFFGGQSLHAGDRQIPLRPICGKGCRLITAFQRVSRLLSVHHPKVRQVAHVL